MHASTKTQRQRFLLDRMAGNNHAVRAAILRDLGEGWSQASIVRRRGYDAELVRRVARARKSAIARLQRGFSPQRVYVIYGEWLTKKECGL
jgi:hypothetical protein